MICGTTHLSGVLSKPKLINYMIQNYQIINCVIVLFVDDVNGRDNKNFEPKIN